VKAHPQGAGLRSNPAGTEKKIKDQGKTVVPPLRSSKRGGGGWRGFWKKRGDGRFCEVVFLDIIGPPPPPRSRVFGGRAVRDFFLESRKGEVKKEKRAGARARGPYARTQRRKKAL